jgi:DNA-binding response OmpR family regulator
MGARILLLEDDVPLACEIQAALARAGCAVEILRDGNAGLARAVSDRFDLVVASLELPGMNGFRLCNRLKKEPLGRAVPIFLLTEQSADVFDEHRKLATHADSYFHKPLTMAELVARVRASVPSLGGAPGQAVEEGADTDLLDDLVITDVDGPPNGAARSIESSHEDSRATDLLRSRIAEHEQTNIRLMHELAESRTSAQKAASSAAEALGGAQREIERWKARASSVSLPPRDPTASSAREELMHRERLVAKDTQIARLRKDLDAAAHASSELREKIHRLEAERPALEQKLEERARHAASLEKLLSSAREDKEQAARRSVDLARRMERARPDIERAELALAREKEGRQADAAAHALALAELGTRNESERREAERQRSEEAVARDQAEATARTQAEQAMRERARAEVSLKVRAELELEFGQAMDDLRGDLEVERAHVFGQMERAHAIAMRRTMENGERERALLVARLAEREKTLADAEHALEMERRGDGARVSAMATRIEALEALVASRTIDIEGIARERDEARTELPALEGEIIALRTELTSMRLQLDDQIILARASSAELVESRQRLAGAGATPGEAHAPLDGEPKSGR